MKLQRLIENLLTFSTWQAQSVGLEVSEFKLRPLIKSVLESQRLTLVSQRVRLDVRVEEIVIAADRSKLKLILDNLLSNAIKFTPQGGTIHIHAQTMRDQLVLDVADTGRGFRSRSAAASSRPSTRARLRRAGTSRAPESGSRW